MQNEIKRQKSLVICKVLNNYGFEESYYVKNYILGRLSWCSCIECITREERPWARRFLGNNLTSFCRNLKNTGDFLPLGTAAGIQCTENVMVTTHEFISSQLL